MLLGATGRLAEPGRLTFGTDHAPEGAACRRLGEGPVTVVVRPWGIAPLDTGRRWACDTATGSWLAWSGHLWPDTGVLATADPGATADGLLARLLGRGHQALDGYDGSFALVWFDGRSGRLSLARDRFGIEPLFWAGLGHSVLFGSRLADMRATGALPGGLSGQGLAEFLTYCWVPGTATLDRGVEQVPAGTVLEIDPARGVVARTRWYRVSFAGPHRPDEREIAEGFRTRLEQAVVRRLGPAPVGLLLSGGMDSSSVLALARRHEAGPIRTFAFRCAGLSFDESHYARALAETLHTEHTEVAYGEPEALLQERLAAEMAVPFCNIGINVGTWLLGGAAAGRVDYVLTGDGGDELWGSHPVYAAQRLLRAYERLPLPGALRRGLHRAADRIHDGDRKRDLRVTLKRILPADELPAALGPWRWRIYYTRRQLDALLTPEAAALVRDCDPYQPVLDAFEGYDGPDDGLSPYLYNDYATESQYYFQRLQLLRHFGVEARSPFYDRALVEYGARIPARLKLEGLERTKRLFRAAMEGVLPDVVNHRKDKLGHSVPLKNWMRGDGAVAGWLAERLAPARVRARGIFRPEAIRQLVDEHRTRRHNHSHRLWSAATLESWLGACVD